MKLTVLFKSCIPFIAGIILATSMVNAQIPTTLQGLEFTISNNSPAPGQTVTVTVESYMADLNSSNITWTLNGAALQKGVGVTSVQVKAPPLGKKNTIEVVAVTPDGKTLNNTLTMSSGGVDLIMEADGYVPPFFQGKMHLTYQNSYRIIAIPHLADSSGKEYDPKNLVYQWTKDSKVIQDQSGYGKQVFTWDDEIVARQRIIGVKVFNRDGTTQAKKIITVEARSPYIGLYVDDPLYGTLLNKALSYQINIGRSRELSVLAIPFGFNKPSDGLGNLSFTWLLNSIKQDPLVQNQSITLRAPENSSGASDIKLTVTNNEELLQKSETNFTANFGGKIQNTPTINSGGI